MKAAPFNYQRPSDAAEAVGMLASSDGGAKACGGSQSLGPMLNLRLVQVEQLVDVSRIASLRAFELRPDALRIGAGVTHARIEDGELPDVTGGLLSAVASKIAYRAVRNRGTVGGSLAHADPSADWVSVMCLLNAQIVLTGPGGERSVPASGFFLGPFTTALEPDEIIVAVDVPRFSADARWAYCKVCRKPGEFADAIAAVWIDTPNGVARALMGALSGMPLVIDDAATLSALQSPASADGAMERLFDEAGVDDLYERDVHAEMLRRAFADLNRPKG